MATGAGLWSSCVPQDEKSKSRLVLTLTQACPGSRPALRHVLEAEGS